jgi:hypothetical protein
MTQSISINRTVIIQLNCPEAIEPDQFRSHQTRRSHANFFMDPGACLHLAGRIGPPQAAAALNTAFVPQA